MSKHFVRSLKNITNGYSSVQIQVRNATSNDSWGPSSLELNEIALLTYHEKYIQDIINIIEKRLNDKGKNWRHVMKALTILLYCVYEGSDELIVWLQNNAHLFKTLREFRYANSRNIDKGGPIRTKARVLTELIEHPEKLEKEKANYRRIRQQMGKPGILDLNSSNNSTTESTGRYTLDLGSTTDRGSPPVTTSDSTPRRFGRASYEGRYSLSLQNPLHSIEEEYTGEMDLVQIASREVLQMS